MQSTGLIHFMQRKSLKSTDVAQLLGCSNAVVSLYLSDKSGISLDKLCILLKNGMSVEEAFGDEVGSAIRNQINNDKKSSIQENAGDSLSVVLDGLEKMIAAARKSVVSQNYQKADKTGF